LREKHSVRGVRHSAKALCAYGVRQRRCVRGVRHSQRCAVVSAAGSEVSKWIGIAAGSAETQGRW